MPVQTNDPAADMNDEKRPLSSKDTAMLFRTAKAKELDLVFEVTPSYLVNT
jgi:hypothetical protein